MRWVCRASRELLLSHNFPGVVSPLHSAEGSSGHDRLGDGVTDVSWAAGGGMLCSPLSFFPGSCSHGPCTPQNFPCMPPKQVCQMAAYICHPCDFFQPGFKNSFWAIMCHIRINLHAGASFLSPQNNSTTVSTFQSCLFFFFFFFLLQKSTASAAKGHSIIRKSSAWSEYKTCKIMHSVKKPAAFFSIQAHILQN